MYSRVSADIYGTVGFEKCSVLCCLAAAFTQLLSGCSQSASTFFSEAFPKGSEPLTPEMLAWHRSHSATRPLLCVNMFHLIESDTKSIMVYSKVTLANLDMKSIAWDFSQRN